MDRLMFELTLSLFVIAFAVGMMVHLTRYALRKIQDSDNASVETKTGST